MKAFCAAVAYVADDDPARRHHGEAAVRLVFLGPPGAGKGTQAARCAVAWRVVHISTGDLFRAEATRATTLGQQLASYMQRGVLVPDALVVELVSQRLGADDAQAGFILDGFPRTVAQATAVDATLATRQQPIELAVHFATSAAVMLRRLSGRRICRSCGANYHVETLRPSVAGHCDHCQGALYQRADDQPETILKRLDIYRAESEDLLLHYRQRGLLRDVNGDLELEAMQRRLAQLVTEEHLLPVVR